MFQHWFWLWGKVKCCRNPNILWGEGGLRDLGGVMFCQKCYIRSENLLPHCECYGHTVHIVMLGEYLFSHMHWCLFRWISQLHQRCITSSWNIQNDYIYIRQDNHIFTALVLSFIFIMLSSETSEYFFWHEEWSSLYTLFVFIQTVPLIK